LLTSTFFINDTPIKILYDSRATHSFISEQLIRKMGLKGSHTNSAYKIITLVGQITSEILICGVC
jgi:predicted aspartyl protease